MECLFQADISHNLELLTIRNFTVFATAVASTTRLIKFVDGFFLQFTFEFS